MPISIQDRAVVLGGSIAGLLAAAVLAQHYGDVTVVERDQLPVAALQRRGVPQGRHVHGLLPRGRQLLGDLFPGIVEDLIAHGALSGDLLGKIRWYIGGSMLPQVNSGLLFLNASRPLIEAAIRDRVRALPNVTVRDNCTAAGLRLAADGRRIIGAKITTPGGQDLLYGDLVVDATGRGSRSRRWLAALGYPPPPTDRRVIQLRYASARFGPSPAASDSDLMVNVLPTPGQWRSGIAQRIEGGQILVTLAGAHGERPPVDPDGFVDYAASLAAPDVARIVRTSRRLSDPVAFHCPAYERHHYERAARFPTGMLVIGDAVCSFHPGYSEGISVAAWLAAKLGEQLRKGQPTAEHYFRDLSAALDAPWALDSASYPATFAEAGAKHPLPPEYRADLELAATQDPQLAIAFVRVAGLIDPPWALLDPVIQGRVNLTVSALSRHAISTG